MGDEQGLVDLQMNSFFPYPLNMLSLLSVLCDYSYKLVHGAVVYQVVGLLRSCGLSVWGALWPLSCRKP